MNNDKMKAVVVAAAGPQLAQVARPAPKPNEVLVRVRAAALNRADLLVASGHQHGASGGAGTVIGMEWAGEVAQLGADVPAGLFKAGDAVMCSGQGAYAEYAVADWGRVYPLPGAGMGFAQAAALPIALQTAHEALTASGALRRGDTVLVQGASSGVGLMSLQIAQLLGASLVIGSSTNAARRAQLAEFGAGMAVDSSDAQWPQQVLQATGGAGVDLIIDFIAGDTMNRNLLATKVRGRIVNVGRMGGFSGPFDFDLHALRRIRYIGATFRTRTREEVREIAANMKRDLWEHLSAARLRMPVSRTFGLADAAQALELMRSNAHFGKLVLET